MIVHCTKLQLPLFYMGNNGTEAVFHVRLPRSGTATFQFDFEAHQARKTTPEVPSQYELIFAHAHVTALNAS